MDEQSRRITQNTSSKMNAVKKLEDLRKSVPELDYEKELEEYREVKYGNKQFTE